MMEGEAWERNDYDFTPVLDRDRVGPIYLHSLRASSRVTASLWSHSLCQIFPFFLVLDLPVPYTVLG